MPPSKGSKLLFFIGFLHKFLAVCSGNGATMPNLICMYRIPEHDVCKIIVKDRIELLTSLVANGQRAEIHFFNKNFRSMDDDLKIEERSFLTKEPIFQRNRFQHYQSRLQNLGTNLRSQNPQPYGQMDPSMLPNARPPSPQQIGFTHGPPGNFDPNSAYNNPRSMSPPPSQQNSPTHSYLDSSSIFRGSRPMSPSNQPQIPQQQAKHDPTSVYNSRPNSPLQNYMGGPTHMNTPQTGSLLNSIRDNSNYLKNSLNGDINPHQHPEEHPMPLPEKRHRELQKPEVYKLLTFTEEFYQNMRLLDFENTVMKIDMQFKDSNIGGFGVMATPLLMEHLEDTMSLMAAVNSLVENRKLFLLVDPSLMNRIHSISKVKDLVDFFVVKTVMYMESNKAEPWTPLKGPFTFSIEKVMSSFISVGIPQSQLVPSISIHGQAFRKVSPANDVKFPFVDNSHPVTTLEFYKETCDTPKIEQLVCQKEEAICYVQNKKRWTTFETPFTGLIKGQFLQSKYLGIALWNLENDRLDNKCPSIVDAIYEGAQKGARENRQFKDILS